MARKFTFKTAKKLLEFMGELCFINGIDHSFFVAKGDTLFAVADIANTYESI